MIYRIVKYLGKTIVPNVKHVIGHICESSSYVVSPDPIFRKIGCDVIVLTPFQ